MAAGVGAGGFPLVFGLNTFGDTTNDDDGHRVSHAQTIRDVVEEGVFAERAGVGFFGIGEHHTDDMPLSAADVALAAIAAGSLVVGSPATVAPKIASIMAALGASRFDLKYGMGALSHRALMTNIELYGTEVVPRVRDLLAS
jgi:alkanesulfonate monooxygenase SsuD/methylene tetrahydromethanopterin reductase-like flavin-dependent oxidoreductase (luciferase family)